MLRRCYKNDLQYEYIGCYRIGYYKCGLQNASKRSCCLYVWNNIYKLLVKEFLCVLLRGLVTVCARDIGCVGESLCM